MAKICEGSPVDATSHELLNSSLAKNSQWRTMEREGEGGRCLEDLFEESIRADNYRYIYIYVGRSSGTFSIFGGAKSYSRVVILLEEDGEGAGKCA